VGSGLDAGSHVRRGAPRPQYVVSCVRALTALREDDWH
jgi:hypothetical protein